MDSIGTSVDFAALGRLAIEGWWRNMRYENVFCYECGVRLMWREREEKRGRPPKFCSTRCRVRRFRREQVPAPTA